MIKHTAIRIGSENSIEEILKLNVTINSGTYKELSDPRRKDMYFVVSQEDDYVVFAITRTVEELAMYEVETLTIIK